MVVLFFLIENLNLSYLRLELDKFLLEKRTTENTIPKPTPDATLIKPSAKHRSTFSPNSISDLVNFGIELFALVSIIQINFQVQLYEIYLMNFLFI